MLESTTFHTCVCLYVSVCVSLCACLCVCLCVSHLASQTAAKSSHICWQIRAWHFTVLRSADPCGACENVFNAHTVKSWQRMKCLKWCVYHLCPLGSAYSLYCLAALGFSPHPQWHLTSSINRCLTKRSVFLVDFCISHIRVLIATLERTGEWS